MTCCEKCYDLSPALGPSGVYTLESGNPNVWFYPDGSAVPGTETALIAQLVSLVDADASGSLRRKCASGSMGTPTTIYSEEYFARSANGLAQSANRNSLLTISRGGVGQWKAALNTPHPDGIEYHPSFTVEEQDDTGHRDSPYIQIVQGSLSATGFKFMITTGDNGTAADNYIDTPFTVGIDTPVQVLKP